MQEWTNFIQEGLQFLRTARNGQKRKAVFTNEIIYNLIGLSLEKMLVGLCMRHGHMPADHTLAGIVAEVNDLCPMDTTLAEEIQAMDRIQDLCALDMNSFCTVSDRQVAQLLSLNERVAAFVNQHIGSETADH